MSALATERAKDRPFHHSEYNHHHRVRRVQGQDAAFDYANPQQDATLAIQS
jgi:hypothetical protein